MTREEKQKAIDAIKISAPYIVMTQEEYNTYIQTRIKLIDWLEQEPCEDAVSRQAVIDAIKNYASMLWEKYHEPFPESTIMEMIQELPPVTPQPKSEWEHDHEILRTYSDGANAVLATIREEIEHMIPCSKETLSMKLGVLEIIDKYIVKSEVQDDAI